MSENIKVVELDGESLTIEQVHAVARERATLKLADSAKKTVKKGQEVVMKLVEAGEAIYGVTTGIGEFSRIRVSKEQSLELQKRIIYSHAAGVGDPVPPDVVRGGMVLRANCMAKGITGVRLSSLETWIEMVNRDVVPYVHEKGSVGTSGDLSPMSELATVIMGEGVAFYKGKQMPGAEAMKAAGLEPITLTYKEGLGLINGSQMMTALGALILYDAYKLFKCAQISSAMTIDVLKSVMKAFDARLHAIRPFTGQNLVAANLRQLVAESEIIASQKGKVQDGYSLRCTPQVLGPVYDALNYARHQIEIEANAGADNPVFILEDEVCLTGGNFHGQPIAAALDFVGMVLTFMCGLSERHTNRLLNPVLSGLPDFLVEGKGLNSGLMVSQYTAAALTSENKVLSHPACVDSISVSADQEDYVSMGPISAFTARDILENAYGVIAIEMMCAAQAMDFVQPLKPGKGTGAAYKEVRKVVTHLEDDRVLYPDIDAILKIIKDGTVLKAVEDAAGPLKQ